MAVKDKVVLVTGGARGMGREYVRGFLREGAKVIATDLSWSPSGASNDDIDFFAEVKDNPNVLAEIMDITIDSHVKRVYDLAIEKFGEVRCDKIIFTKLDEAAHVGTVLNVVRRLNKALSYITTGQDVPDDIEVGRGKRLAQLILGNSL